MQIIETDQKTFSMSTYLRNIDFPVVFFDIIGSTTTFMSMIPLGIFGALLTDKLLLQIDEEISKKNVFFIILRVSLDTIIFITAVEGKRRLVRFFNTETFKNFGRLEWWKNTFLSRWTIINTTGFVLNSIFTIVASAVFSGIAAISFDGIAKLLESYDWFITDKIGEWVSSYYVKAPFMLATFISDIPFFPVVHKITVNMLLNGLHYLIENPEFRHNKQLIVADLFSAQLAWKKASEKHDIEDISTFLNDYHLDEPDNLLERNLIQIGQSAHTKVQLESWLEFLTKHTTAIILSGIGIAGLYNFLDMTDKVTSLFHIEKASPVLRWMDYLSMSAVAFTSIYGAASIFVSRVFFGRNYTVNLINRFSYTWILLSSIIVCILGGTPNTYQSILADETLAMILIASIDSLLIEVYGYYQLTMSNKISSICKNNAFKTQTYEVNTAIENTINRVNNIYSKEELNNLCGTQYTAPAYRPTYTSIKSYFNYFLFTVPVNIVSTTQQVISTTYHYAKNTISHDEPDLNPDENTLLINM